MVHLIMDFLNIFSETLGTSDTLVGGVLVGTVLVMLYALTILSRKVRLIENELQSIRKDQSVMSDELEIVAMKGDT